MKKYIKVIVDNYKSRKDLNLFFYWILLRIKKIFKIGFFQKNCDYKKKIDVVIPTVSKDFEVLKLTIESLKLVKHKINKIYIVAPEDSEIKNFCNTNNLELINEKEVLGFGKEKINYVVNGIDRSGWLFQQLLKLSGENFTEMENYLVIDSDTIFVNENCFIENGKFIFFVSEEWHKPYIYAINKLLGIKNSYSLSFVAHGMIFNKRLLQYLKKDIEDYTGLLWIEAILSLINDFEQSCFSEYELYVNWLLYKYPKKAKILPFFNKSMSKKELDKFDNLQNKFKNFKSVSFHSYMKD